MNAMVGPDMKFLDHIVDNFELEKAKKKEND